MQQDTFSRTALGAARQRLAHQLLDDDHKVLDDPVIEKIIGDKVLNTVLVNQKLYKHPYALAFRAHIVLRSRLAEDCLRQGYDNGIRQLLIMGAGFDTFAYRQPKWAKAMKIFEIDHPATQAEKRKRLTDAGIAIPDNLVFVPIDFETQELKQELFRHGFAIEQPAFISWLGVSMYLSPEAVDKMFAFAASCAAQSQFVFTFAQERHVLSEGDEAQIPRFTLADAAAQSGEPWLTFFTPEKLAEILQSHGFSVSFFDPALIQPYFAQRTDGLIPPKRINMVKATV